MIYCKFDIKTAKSVENKKPKFTTVVPTQKTTEEKPKSKPRSKRTTKVEDASKE